MIKNPINMLHNITSSLIHIPTELVLLKWGVIIDKQHPKPFIRIFSYCRVIYPFFHLYNYIFQVRIVSLKYIGCNPKNML